MVTRLAGFVSQFRIEGLGSTSGTLVGPTARHFRHSRPDLKLGSFRNFASCAWAELPDRSLAPPLVISVPVAQT